MDREEASRLVTMLFDRWYSFLVRYATRSTGSFELAEDLAQDTFMQLYKALREGKTIEHPKAWTLCVLRRSLSRVTRIMSRDRELIEPFNEAELSRKVGPEALSGDQIRHFLAVLTPREEEVLLLRLEALKYREIADQLGISMNSVNTLLSRALRKLQQAMSRRTRERSPKQHASQNASTTPP